MPKITCPSCATSYELPDGSIEPSGRKVKCATCGTKWMAKPETIPLKDPALDSVTSDFEDNVDMEGWGLSPAPTPKSASPTKVTPVDVDFDTDPDTKSGHDDVGIHPPPMVQEPPTRIRPVNPLMRSTIDRKKAKKPNRYEIREQTREQRKRILRPLALLGTMMVIAFLILIRDNVVRTAPDLAGLYQMIGFRVNLSGFEIRNVRAERVVETTGPVLIISGEIENIKTVIAQTPKLRFALKTNTSEEIYGWTHELSVPTIVPGGTTRFQSRLPSPPPLGRNLTVRFTNQ